MDEIIPAFAEILSSKFLDLKVNNFRVELIEEELSAVCCCSVTKSCPIFATQAKSQT